MPSTSSNINIFIAYALQDQPILEELKKQLYILERKKEISIWYDGMIEAGKEWAKETDKAIDNAQIILLLVSSDFITSDECYENQLQKALKKHKKGTAKVIPVIVRDCLWEETSFGHIKALPLAAIPVVSSVWEKEYNSKDTPYMKVAAAISKQVKTFKAEHEKKAKKVKNKVSKKTTKNTPPKRKRGRILYNIPTKMQKEVAHTCIIRIAPEDLPKKVLKEYLDNADQAQIEGLRRIGKYMKVELLDSSNAFIIETQSTEEQVVEEDDYTEWRYKVTPFLSGNHRLQLKVAVTLTRDKHGKEYKDVVVLDKKIEVVTEEVETAADWAMVKDDSPSSMIVVHSSIEDEDKEPPPAHQAKIRVLPFLRKYSKALGMFLLFVLFLPTATWAAAPQIMVEPYLNLVYEEHKELSDGRIAIKDKSGKWGVVNAHGIQSTKPKYEKIEADKSGIIQVQKDGKWGALQAEDISDKGTISRVWNNIIAPDDVEVVPTVSEKPPIKLKGTNQVQVQINGKLDTLPKIPPKKIKQDAPEKLQKAIQKLPTAERKVLKEVQQLLDSGDATKIRDAETKLATLETTGSKQVVELAKQQKAIVLQKRTVEVYKVVEEVAEAEKKGDVQKLVEKQEQLKQLKKKVKAVEDYKVSEPVVQKRTLPKTPVNPEPADKTTQTPHTIQPNTPSIEDRNTQAEIIEEETEETTQPQKEVEPADDEVEEIKTAEKTEDTAPEPIETKPTDQSKDTPNTISNQNAADTDSKADNTPIDNNNTSKPKDTPTTFNQNSDEVNNNTTKPPKSEPSDATTNVADTEPEPTSTPTETKKDLPSPIDELKRDMVPVQGGTFQMGCTSEQGNDCMDREKPVHSVTVSSFKIAKYEVTQAQWEAVMGNNPSKKSPGCKNCPVESVSWNDVQDFIKKLNQQTGKKFRLSTEAEWEFAARGGTKSKGYKYAGSNTIDDVAWYTKTTNDSGTKKVGTKNPNELGLYDMSGNVYEWCSDWYSDYSSDSQKNPSGASTGTMRVLRGGSWSDNANYCRVSHRYRDFPSDGFSLIGLRLVEDF